MIFLAGAQIVTLLRFSFYFAAQDLGAGEINKNSSDDQNTNNNVERRVRAKDSPS
jgi:hypothetical protein